MSAQFAKGDRFEDADWRSAGRVVEVKEVLDDTPNGTADYLCIVEVHPKNPGVVGRETMISERTLSDRRRYRKISR